MVIVLDNIIFNLQKSGGISVVWYELLNRLIKDSSIRKVFIDACPQSNVLRNMLSIEKSLIVKEEFHPFFSLFPVRVNYTEPFIFHSSYYRFCNNNKAINITTVHDFTYEYYRGGLAKWKHSWQKYNAIRHSDYIVCISENTKNDLIKFLPDIDENRIRVIYNGVSNDYFETKEGFEELVLPFKQKSYVVFVGSRTSYKNFALTVKGVSSSSYNLVVVGSKLSDEEMRFVYKYIPQERVYCPGFITNKDLNVVYNNAAALIYPSSYEGFGIPVIEAQRSGCPVIAFNSSSIPEVIGDTPLLMNELTVKELHNKIALLSDKQLMDDIRTVGVENSKRFSWDKMYNQYVDLYKEALL